MPIKPVDQDLFVISVISNPSRWESRYDLYKAFSERMSANKRVHLYTAELSQGERQFEITDHENDRHIRFRSTSEIWSKENLINLAISRLPFDAEYICWCDADISFLNRDWAEETIHQLQRYDIVQCFQHAIDLGPEDEFTQSHRGFAYAYIKEGFNFPNMLKPDGYYGSPKMGAYAHPGYVWAAKRSALDELGGLIDWAVLGSADYHICTAILGLVEKSVPKDSISERYMKKLLIWQERAMRLKYNMGYVSGTIAHYWHGPKMSRGYTSRWGIIQRNNFDPDTDLKRDSRGLYQLAGNKPRLRDEIRAYFDSRKEDSVDA